MKKIRILQENPFSFFIYLPKKILTEHGWKKGDGFSLSIEEKKIILEKVQENAN